ncbi:MAG: recombinase family protein, partial [Anaerolineales bacterium]|nr:recombinase family protein [Anaerolineales bacterium]
MKKRAVLYARVSSDDRRREGRNLKGQLDMCREHAIKNDWEIVAELQEDDRGARGADFDLPKLTQALDMASAGDFDYLVTREMDRFSRKLAKQLVVEDEFRRCGVQIEYVLADYEDTPEGELNKHVRAVIAEYERKKINERMKRGKRLKVKSGQVLVFGKAPYGYRTVAENNKTTFEIIESEAAIVRLIFTWYVIGDEEGIKLSITGIARKLTEMKVPTWEDTHGKGKKRNKYGHWTGSAVANILTSETYAGVWAY